MSVVVWIVVTGLILSSVLIGIDYLTGRWKGPNQPSDEEAMIAFLEEECRRLEDESAGLEQEIAENGATVENLESLAGMYQQLIYYSSLLNTEPEEYMDKAAATYLSLLDLEPDSIEHRFSLFEIYRSGKKENLAREQAGILKEALEKLKNEEKLSNTERYYYAVLMVDIYDQRDEALEQLEHILDTEPEDSQLYSFIAGYKQYLESLNDDAQQDEDKDKGEEDGDTEEKVDQEDQGEVDEQNQGN